MIAVRNVHPEAGTRKLQVYLTSGVYCDPITIGRDRLFDILKRSNMLIKRTPKKARTTYSNKYLQIPGNLLKDTPLTHSYQALVADITYISTELGFLFLALITDAYTREIIGYSINDTLETEGCLEALEMASKQIPKGATPIHHSDRGCQYASHPYANRLKQLGYIASMTEEQHCYENAKAERVNGILKREYYLDAKFPTKALAKEAVKRAIYVYNNLRIHDALSGLTPVEFRKRAA